MRPALVVMGRDVIGENPGFVFGTLLALFSIYAGYVFYKRAAKPKTLDFARLVSTSLLSPVSPRVKEQLVLTWNGEKVEEPKVIEVKIQNTGKQAVVRSDYDVPITITVTNGKVLGTHIRNAIPEEAVSDADVEIDAEGKLVKITPKLLNL